MKDLVSQDYIDYQDGRDHFRYFGQPVDPLGKDSQNYYFNPRIESNPREIYT